MEFFDIKELRVGNLLTTIKGTKHYKRELEVENIIDNNTNLDEPLTLVNGYETHEIKPIPLDDEVMERLGFTSKWTKGVFGVATTSEHSDYVFYQECEENGIAYFPKPLKYVHELQNMYYALTGEELTINEI